MNTPTDKTNTEGVSDERLREILLGCAGVTPGPWHIAVTQDGEDFEGRALLTEVLTQP